MLKASIASCRVCQQSARLRCHRAAGQQLSRVMWAAEHAQQAGHHGAARERFRVRSLSASDAAAAAVAAQCFLLAAGAMLVDVLQCPRLRATSCGCSPPSFSGLDAGSGLFLPRSADPVCSQEPVSWPGSLHAAGQLPLSHRRLGGAALQQVNGLDSLSRLQQPLAQLAAAAAHDFLGRPGWVYGRHASLFLNVVSSHRTGERPSTTCSICTHS